jgi:hypothetical protein
MAYLDPSQSGRAATSVCSSEAEEHTLAAALECFPKDSKESEWIRWLFSRGVSDHVPVLQEVESLAGRVEAPFQSRQFGRLRNSVSVTPSASPSRSLTVRTIFVQTDLERIDSKVGNLYEGPLVRAFLVRVCVRTRRTGPLK